MTACVLSSRRLCAFLGVLAALFFGAAPGESRGASNSIDRIERLAADGALLSLTIRGADSDAPLLLWLHGGPGGAETPLFRYFNGGLEDRFVVAYWDQRGAARSFDPAADPRELTIARHLADLDLVVDHLRRSLAKEKIVLVGHSWGGTLALLYGRRHPQKLAAIIAISPSVAARKQEAAEFEFVTREALRRQDFAALAELRDIGPPPYSAFSKGLAVEKVAARYGAVFHTEPNKFRVMIEGVLRGLVTPWEIPSFIRANEESLRAMHAELGAIDLTSSVPRLETPVAFFLGRYDRHVDSGVAAHYFDALSAPAKRLVWFENSAHNPPFEEPLLFEARLVESLAAIGILSATR